MRRSYARRRGLFAGLIAMAIFGALDVNMVRAWQQPSELPIAPRVSEAFALLGDAFATVAAENEAVLSITCSRTFATNWLAVRIGAFNLLRPGQGRLVCRAEVLKAGRHFHVVEAEVFGQRGDERVRVAQFNGTLAVIAGDF